MTERHIKSLIEATSALHDAADGMASVRGHMVEAARYMGKIGGYDNRKDSTTLDRLYRHLEIMENTLDDIVARMEGQADVE